jgi:hypothetical protein
MLRRLPALLLASSLLAAACAPTVKNGGTRPTPVQPVKPVQPVAPQPTLDRDEVRTALMERRATTFQRFILYREARVYPVNDFDSGFAHVWVDASGNLCAAATIISGDWGRDVTAMVATEDNFIALAGVHDGPLADWILTSGLTHHEIVAIQVPGWQGNRPEPQPQPEPDPRAAEIARLYDIYIDVERQLSTMWLDSIEDATDALMARPDLAAALLDGEPAGPGRYAEMLTRSEPPAIGFAQPPPG